jgi:transposase
VVRGALARAQKKARRQGQTIVWVDEASFYLLAGVVRSYAPRKHTPILHVPLTRDHLSAISGITQEGELLLVMQERAYKGVDVVRFLKYLLRHIEGRLLVIWDGVPIHHDSVVEAFLALVGTERLCIERLPSYAPDLNPDEGVWNYLKHVELRNLSCHNLAELRHELRLAATRLQHKPDVIRGFIKQFGY